MTAVATAIRAHLANATVIYRTSYGQICRSNARQKCLNVKARYLLVNSMKH